MAFRLYVGNYPSNFTRKDVENLFCDFDGIEVDTIICKEKKSFSFLVCKNIEQLVSVIKKMNKTKVSGRNLIVRASDKNLQEYVDLILKNDESSTPEASASSPTKIPLVPAQGMRSKYRQPHGKSISEKPENIHYTSDANNFQKSFSKDNENSRVPTNKSNYSYRQPYKNSNSETPTMHSKSSSIDLQESNWDENHGDSANKSNFSSRSIYNQRSSDGATSGNDSGCMSKSPNKVYYQRNPRNNESSENHHSPKSPMNSSQFPRNNESPGNNSYSSKSPLNSNQFARNNESPENKHEYFERDSISFSSSKSFHNNSNGTGVQDSSYTEMRDTSSLAWVSVSNFRFYTPNHVLFELFSDYNPLQVRMVNNVPRRDRALCEALVCFPSTEIADDVILNFDNTVFQGRVILVNDALDLTLLNDLLNVTHS